MSPEVALREPLARRILGEALNRLDRVPIEERTNAIRIPIDRASAPELFEADTAGDRALAWHVLEVIEAAGFGTIAYDKPPRHGTPLERKPRFVVAPEAEERLRTVLDRPRPGVSYLRAWEALVDQSPLSDLARQTISRAPITITGRTADEVFQRLLWIRDQHTPGDRALLREVSAKAFWGLSKVLDARQDVVAALLDLDECPYLEQPVHLNVFFAGSYDHRLIFIENKTSFERAIRDYQEAMASKVASPYHGTAVIFSSGYVGAAKKLRIRQYVRTFYALDDASSPASIEPFGADFFSSTDLPTWFWGDLDFSGMSILQRIRANFPSASAWREGYAPMLAQLDAGHGHTPLESGKEGQRTIASTGCPYADAELIPAIVRHARFVDQEGFRVRRALGVDDSRS
jgi:hypothetical protein